MDAAQIIQVRRFNRLVTQRAGVLEDSYLRRGRPIGEARLLYEIGPSGADVRDLRQKLALEFRLCQPPAAIAGTAGPGAGAERRGRRPCPPRRSDPRGAGRTQGVRPAVRRAGEIGPVAPHASATKPPCRRHGRGRTAAAGRRRGHQARGPDQRRRAHLHQVPTTRRSRNASRTASIPTSPPSRRRT